jgi:hypothetical protein
MLFLFLHWRGRGPLAVVVLIMPLACCAGLMDVHVGLTLLLCSVALFAGGVVCLVCGRQRSESKESNRLANEHTYAFIPLQYWGMLYMSAGIVFTAASIARMIRG